MSPLTRVSILYATKVFQEDTKPKSNVTFSLSLLFNSPKYLESRKSRR